MTPRVPLFLFLLVCLLCADASARDDDYLTQLQQQARALTLAQTPAWQALGHYRHGVLFDRWESEADDAQFFFSPRGKNDPERELMATLAALFQPSNTNPDQHPQCRFPARYAWLKQQLNFDSARLIERQCPELTKWFTTINPGSITMIFPAAYLNSPSSMFGHTLLRINSADRRKHLAPVAYSLSYAAHVRENEIGVVFAYKGIFGGYPGVFSIVPYHEKIREYSDMESRDVWEYDLDLNQPEVEQLMRHAWELRHINFDYYFFDENCSYRLLSLLDVARPGLALADQFPVKAIPADTVRATDDKNLKISVHYRPSSTALLKHKVASTTKEQQARALELAQQPSLSQSTSFQRLSVDDQARELELAYDYLYYQMLRNPTQRDPRAPLAYQLLASRSKLAVTDVWSAVPTPETRTEQGHRSARIALGAGRDDNRNYGVLHLRPAYHDLVDPRPGYASGAQINFLDLALRYQTDDEKNIQLERFTLIDILSLSPRDKFFTPLSWGTDLGIERRKTMDGDIHPWQVTGLVGHSYQWASNNIFSALLTAKAQAHEQLQDGYALGAGIQLSLLTSFSQSQSMLTYRALRFVAGEESHGQQASWQHSFHLGGQNALRYTLRWERDERDDTLQGELAWHRYF